ncbi:hypothetical protein [Thiosocius teredinicola]|uniref:hypothetical protein n=1 Tax=Thiosocius teredinicola TaxID=1973002 RepID=UPI0013DDB715
MQNQRTGVSVTVLGMRYIGFTMLLLMLLIEPALANKFETIGGGVAGSSGIKREWLQKFFLVAGGISLFGAFLAVVVPRNNALFLNFRNWKASAAVLTVLSIIFFGAAFLF